MTAQRTHSSVICHVSFCFCVSYVVPGTRYLVPGTEQAIPGPYDGCYLRWVLPTLSAQIMGMNRSSEDEKMTLELEICTRGFLEQCSFSHARRQYCSIHLAQQHYQGSTVLVHLKYTRRSLYSCVSPCLLYTSPSPRDKRQSRMPSSA